MALQPTLLQTAQAPEAGVPRLLFGVAAVGLALVHLLASRLAWLDAIPRRRVLSLAGGASVAYVFVHLLPELDRGREHVVDLLSVGAFEHVAYLVVLAGFTTYYGLERFVRAADGRGEPSAPGVFWLHMASFAAYNGLLGYLLFHREVSGLAGLGLYSVAVGLHFFVNDYGLREHHPEAYQARGRWVLSAAVLAGAGLGAVTAIDPRLLEAFLAFLAGGIVLNVIKEELPAERESRFLPFAAGAAGYAALLLAV